MIMSTIRQLHQDISQRLNADTAGGGRNVFSDSENEIFQYMWKSEVLREITIPDGNPNINRKGAKESEEFRNEGNRLYRDKKFEKALLAYNYALLSAPHPSEIYTITQEDSDNVLFKSTILEGQYSHLAFAFANRSALLLEMEQFQFSISDINNAILYGYTHSKQYKMFERKIKCLIELRKFEKAKNLLSLLLDNLTNFPVNPKELSQLKSNLSKQTSVCVMALTNPEEPCKLGTSSNLTLNECNKSCNFSHLFYQGEHTLEVTPSIRDLGQVSTALQVQYTEKHGRHLIATKKINPGEVLAVESSLYSYVLYDQRQRLYCNGCLKRASVPLPCPHCSLVVFCSPFCRRTAMAPSSGVHNALCSLLPALVALQPELDAALAITVLASSSLQNIKTLDSQLRTKDHSKTNVCNQPFKIEVNKDVTLNDFSETNSYESIFTLEGNQSNRTEKDKKDAIINALIIMKLLSKIPMFWNNFEITEDKLSLNSDDFVVLGEHIVRILYNIQCNAHCVKELRLIENQTSCRDSYNNVGYAIYQCLSLLNHSCAANTHQSSNGSQKVLFAVSTIDKGEELTLSYGERYVSHSKVERQKNLAKSYFFTCDCIPCEMKWPVFDQLPTKFSLRCSKCKSPLDSNTFSCKNCKLIYKNNSIQNCKKGKKRHEKQTTPQNLYDAQARQKDIIRAWTDYNESHKNITMLTSSKADFQTIVKILSLLDAYAHHPNKPYIDAQETLILWYDQRSAATFTSN